MMTVFKKFMMSFISLKKQTYRINDLQESE